MMDYNSTDYDTIFSEEYTITYTITYTMTNGRTIRIVKAPYFKKQDEPELQTGDSAALDAFLGGFANA